MNLMDLMPYVWITVMILAVVVEAATLNLIAIWFMPSGVLSLILSIVAVSVWLQVLLFFVTAAILLVVSQFFFRRFLKPKQAIATNADALIGESALVTEEISNIQNTGLVKVKGQLWSARSDTPEFVYPIGEVVAIVRIEGVKLIITKN